MTWGLAISSLKVSSTKELSTPQGACAGLVLRRTEDEPRASSIVTGNPQAGSVSLNGPNWPKRLVLPPSPDAHCRPQP